MQWYKKALVGRTRIHVPNNDKAGILVSTTSCMGVMSENSAKFCTDDGCQEGCMAAGEKAPWFLSRLEMPAGAYERGTGPFD